MAVLVKQIYYSIISIMYSFIDFLQQYKIYIFVEPLILIKYNYKMKTKKEIDQEIKNRKIMYYIVLIMIAFGVHYFVDLWPYRWITYIILVAYSGGHKSIEKIIKKSRAMNYTAEMKSMSKDELLAIDEEVLKEIAETWSYKRREGEKFFRESMHQASVYIQDGLYEVEKNFDKILNNKDQDLIDAYNNKVLKELELNLKAEVITKDQYNVLLNDAKELLKKKIWKISQTDESVAEQLYDLGLISKKELQVVIDRVEEEEGEKERIKEKKKNWKKEFYIDYILGNVKLKEGE